MAAALANIVQNAEFYVSDLKQPEPDIRSQFPDVLDSPLRIRNLRMTHQPYRLLSGTPAVLYFNSRIALGTLGRHMKGIARKQENILFVRSRLERKYWGLLRRCFPWMRNWIFVAENHDNFSIHASERRRAETLRTLANFDLVLCLTQALADDLECWTNGSLQPHVVRHASGLPRIPNPPQVHLNDRRITLGYVGTIDKVRGADSLIKAMKHLPNQFLLRLVGRIPDQAPYGQLPEWLDELLRDPEIREKVEIVPHTPAAQVFKEIDVCDFVLQPASNDMISLRYRAPLKLFDYMVRGKPIIAADVPCHREMLRDGFNACLYRYDDVRHLAESVKSLASQPMRAEAISRSAWEQSSDFTYEARAQRILELVREVQERRLATID